MINFLADDLLLSGYSCAGTRIFPVFQMAKFFIVIIQIAVPFALVIFGSLDFFKALVANDEKEMQKRRKPFFSRVIAALIIFFLPWFVQFISTKAAGKKSTPSFWKCYSEAKPKIDFSAFQNKSTGGSGEIIGGSSGSAVNGGTPTNPTITTKGGSGGSGESGGSGGSGGTTTTPTVKVSCSKYQNSKKSDGGKADCNAGSTATYHCKWNDKTRKCVNGIKKATGSTGGSGGSTGGTATTKSCSEYTTQSTCAANGCKWTTVPGTTQTQTCMKKYD